MAKKKNLVRSFFSEMSKCLPNFATFEKVLEEFVEHKEFALWVFVRVVVPVIVLHLVINFLIFEKFKLSPTIFGIAIFFYATFLIDLDSFFNQKKGSKKATTTQKILILLFAPAAIYYLLSKRIKPIYIPPKFFHRKKSMAIFTLFAFLLGYLLFFNLPDAFFFALFAFIGYLTHLVADKIILIK